MNTYSKDKMYESYSSEVERMQKCIDELQQENKQLKEQLLVTQTNEETFRLEMKDITKILGLAEDTLFDDVKVYARNLKDNWNKLKEYCKENTLCYEVGDDENTKLIGSKIHGLNVLDKMRELEQGSD